MWILIVITLIALLSAYFKSPKGRGWLGERKVRRIIGKTKENSRYVINNLIIKTGDNKTTQIDHVLINRKGIFVIETKNYSGRIYGDEKRREWTQVLSGGRVKNKLYNPIMQNKSHIHHISNALSEKLPIISAVVFVQGNTHFIDAWGVYDLRGLKRMIKESETKISNAQMRKAYHDLTMARSHTVKNREHVKNVRATQTNILNNICPRCGKKLVLRNGKRGAFYGCPGYPHCRFTKNL